MAFIPCLRTKLWEWIRRYGPQECCGFVAAFAVAVQNRDVLSDSSTFIMGVVLYGMTIADGVVYYGYGFIRELVRHARVCTVTNPSIVALRAIRDVLAEYWIVEVVDTIVTRPACMYVGLHLTHDLLHGVVLGHVLAGIVFNILVIPCYEIRKKLFPTDESAPDSSPPERSDHAHHPSRT